MLEEGPEVANKIYDILVEECGAWEGDRDMFLFHFKDITEYRFCGNLGFGGKIWRRQPLFSPPSYWVSCYPEDRTPSINEMVQKANARLAEVLTNA